jgi:hypothetical protein
MGNGESIRIWGDKWLPFPSSYQVQSLVEGLDPEAKVICLIDSATAGWNVPLIRSSFVATEADTICSLILSPLGQPDKLVWLGNSNGRFSVRSAYHMEMSRRSSARGECSTSQENAEVWRIIWSLDGPRVLKNFVWKFCANALPTKENLYRRHIVPDPLCPLCSNCTESI